MLSDGYFWVSVSDSYNLIFFFHYVFGLISNPPPIKRQWARLTRQSSTFTCIRELTLLRSPGYGSILALTTSLESVPLSYSVEYWPSPSMNLSCDPCVNKVGFCKIEKSNGTHDSYGNKKSATNGVFLFIILNI